MVICKFPTVPQPVKTPYLHRDLAPPLSLRVCCWLKSFPVSSCSETLHQLSTTKQPEKITWNCLLSETLVGSSEHSDLGAWSAVCHRDVFPRVPPPGASCERPALLRAADLELKSLLTSANIQLQKMILSVTALWGKSSYVEVKCVVCVVSIVLCRFLLNEVLANSRSSTCTAVSDCQLM